MESGGRKEALGFASARKREDEWSREVMGRRRHGGAGGGPQQEESV